MKDFIIYLTSILLLAFPILALDNGLGLTPPMGWNSWKFQGCNITEEIIKSTADTLISSGLAKLGYIYVNIDDCWQSSRENGVIIADKEKFPSGMKSIADYIHSLGLKFGLYSDAGFFTCQRRPGSLSHEDADAMTYAKWEVDYLKYDNCYNDLSSPKKRFPKMRDALKNAGRPIYFSMSNWGRQNPSTWAREVANSWRTTPDLLDSWDSFTTTLDEQEGLDTYAGPGGWNDLDILTVGLGAMSVNEYKAHFALWALFKSPLILGCDLHNLHEDYMKIIKNKELIAVNQDPLGKQGKLVARNITFTGYLDVYLGEVVDGQVVILFNRSWDENKFSVNLKEYGVNPGQYEVKNLYTDERFSIEIKLEEDYIYTAVVPFHSVDCIRLTRAEPKLLQILE